MTKDYGLMYIESIMHRPPQSPSLLFARQANQWINRVGQKFNALSALNLSQEKRQSLKAWLEAEFVSCTLLLEGEAVNGQQIRQLIRAAPEESAALSPSEDLLRRFRGLENFAASHGPKAQLNMDLLLSLHADGEFRKNASPASAVSAEHLPMIVENACRWFAMDSFGELNPVEQAAIALLRLVELAPFAQHNQRTALLAASLFTLRSGLPPIAIRAQQSQAYFAAVQQGLRMNTEPMVELVAVAIEHTLDEMLDFLQADS
jgi:prophage maintenance system killer protein